MLEKYLPERQADGVLAWAERIIQQSHYEALDALTPRPVDAAAERIAPGDVVCLFQVSELVFNREEGSLERLTTVLNALHACGASCLMLLQCRSGRNELYLGAVNKHRYDNVYYLNTIRDILRSSIEGNLPGTELKEIISRREIVGKLNQCLDNGFDSQCVTAISCVAGDREESSVPDNGLERLLEAIGSRNFAIMILADPIDRGQMETVRRGYEQLGSQLSAMEQSSVSLQSGKSTTVSENFTESFSQSIGENLSLTQSHNTGSGWSTVEEDRSARKTKIAALGAAAVGGYFAMNAVSTLLAKPGNTVNGHEDFGSSVQVGKNTNQQQGQQKGVGTALAETEGVTLSYTLRDRHIKALLDRVEWYLQWLNRRENYGMFNCCTYVISSSASVNLLVASQYQALVQGKREISQPVTISTWTRENGVDTVREALLHLMHPVMECDDLEGGLTPAMLLSSKELSRQMALPQRSVVGVSVMEYASFGREVVRKTPLRGGKVMRVGNVSHMGKPVSGQPVLLDMQSMAAHTFVAGTNGSGKSNTVFRMLEGLMQASIPFLVVEPAKGEYKNVFGREPGIKVYGTNRRKTELLRLNPFWFNDDVSCLEHIDKLIEVFNASWSMYAAMPAVLKASIENAYRACGWDLTESTCRGPYRIFPTVRDVLNEFNNKMESTAFSQEVKGNYVGALSTRMESLCNGIYGEIFGGANLTDEELFENSVIIDLSRVGSAETKSMIMGMLVIRLQEYRMTGEAMNLPLRHITVLEEAHHLLRRTSSAQSEEGSNMLGKSVEMISNAIAEMRSYGEGFIIVDQSPGLLDMSVMRNTNTKIILRLPEAGDREIAGNTMGLSAEQIYELSRLKTGVCAIYQKDWLEAVLCQVDRASHEEELYVRPAAGRDNQSSIRLVKALLRPFLSRAEQPGEDVERLKELAVSAGISGVQKAALLRELSAGTAPDWNVRRTLAGSLLEVFPAPVPPENAAPACIDAWQQALLDDPAEKERWGACWPLVLQARVECAAEQSAEWAGAARRISNAAGTADQRLPESRGKALERMCPLHCKKVEMTAQGRDMLEEAYARLVKAGGTDRQLADLLRDSIDQDVIRQRGKLQPYASIVWRLLGGQDTWDSLYAELCAARYEEWDQAARKILSARVCTDFSTQTSVLSLFLQVKGTDQAVRTFFHPWLQRALKAGQKA